MKGFPNPNLPVVGDLRLVADLRDELDVGESEEIALAVEFEADFLLIDEKPGC